MANKTFHSLKNEQKITVYNIFQPVFNKNISGNDKKYNVLSKNHLPTELIE